MLFYFFLVGIGGFFGAISRFAVSLLTRQYISNFPMATFIVNILGCFLAGLLLGVSEKHISFAKDSPLYFFLSVGFLGAFTTFSALGLESYLFLNDDRVSLAFFNVTIQLVLGVCLLALARFFALKFL